MINKSWIMLEGKLSPLGIHGSEVRYTEEFARQMILAFTKNGDKILDPFAGFGTTLIVAEKLGRVPYGVEFEKRRVDHIKKQLKSPEHIIHGSALDIDKYDIPKFDFCMTSPPFMRSFDTKNPFSNYSKKGSYRQYLHDIKRIYTKIKKVMKKNAVIVVEVSNTFGKGKPMTPLA